LREVSENALRLENDKARLDQRLKDAEESSASWKEKFYELDRKTGDYDSIKARLEKTREE